MVCSRAGAEAPPSGYRTGLFSDSSFKSSALYAITQVAEQIRLSSDSCVHLQSHGKLLLAGDRVNAAVRELDALARSLQLGNSVKVCNTQWGLLISLLHVIGQLAASLRDKVSAPCLKLTTKVQ